MELFNSSRQRRRNPRLEDLELRTSQQLVGLIDILLGLILVEGAVAFRSIFTEASTANPAAVIAMVLVYYTAVHSFLDWHIAMEVRPYRILTAGTRNLELVRVLLDFTIMASYSFLILRAHILIQHPDSNLTVIGITYVGIYCAYIAWDELREDAAPVRLDGEEVKPFRLELLVLTVLAAIVLLVLYVVGRGDEWVGLGDEGFNVAFLALELVLIVVYRLLNWQQQLTITKESETWNGLEESFIATVESKIADPETPEPERARLRALRDAADGLTEHRVLSEVIAQLVDHQVRQHQSGA